MFIPRRKTSFTSFCRFARSGDPTAVATNALNRVVAQWQMKSFRQDGAGLADGDLAVCCINRRDQKALDALLRHHGPQADSRTGAGGDVRQTSVAQGISLGGGLFPRHQPIEPHARPAGVVTGGQKRKLSPATPPIRTNSKRNQGVNRIHKINDGMLGYIFVVQISWPRISIGRNPGCKRSRLPECACK
jgi:hypothetical protein